MRAIDPAWANQFDNSLLRPAYAATVEDLGGDPSFATQAEVLDLATMPLVEVETDPQYIQGDIEEFI